MVGYYASPDFSQEHSFLYSNGICTTIDVIDASPGSTWAYGINNNGQIVGSYGNGSSTAGFTLDGAVYYSFNYVNANGTTNETVPNSINDAAQIAGWAQGGYVLWYNAFEEALLPAP